MAVEDRKILGGPLTPVYAAGGMMQVELLNPDGGEPLNTDEITGALTVIPTVHHEVHEGDMFTSSFIAQALADDATLELLLRTGATKFVHLTFFASCGGDAEIALLESVTVNSSGVQMNERNNKRTENDNAELVVSHTPTTVGGIFLLEAILPGGTGGNASGGLLRQDTEFILKQSADYLLSLTNRSGAAKPAGIVINWYEEGDN